MKVMIGLLLLIPCTAVTALLQVVPAVMKATARPVHAAPDRVGVHASAPVDARFAAAAAEAERLARTLAAEGNLPGLSVAVGVDGELAWAAGLGWADIAAREPVTPDTLFRIGTTSKALTSVGAGLLAASGRLDLDAPVQRYLPDFPMKSVAIGTGGLELPPMLHSLLPEVPGQAAPVSTRQAMAHTAGFRDHRGEVDYLPHYHCEGMADALALFAEDPLEFAPGTDKDFSSFGWILVSAVVEAAAGQPFEAFMDQAVLTPLGMEHTMLDAPDRDPPGRVAFYWPRANADTAYGLEDAQDVDYSCFSGAMAYLSTPSDLVRFGLAMDRHLLLDAATTRMLQTPVATPSGRWPGFALGWHVEQVPFAGGETRVIGHHGFAVGGSTVFQRFPEHGVVVAATSNVTYVTGDLAAFATQVAELFAAANEARTP